MRRFLNILLLILVCSPTVFGQSNTIIVGTIESNFTDFKLDKSNPYVGTILFYKNKNEWNVLEDSFYSSKQNFNIYYQGKKIGNVISKLDTSIRYQPHFWYPYKSNQQIPKIGKKSFLFSGMDAGEGCYRPLLISNSAHCLQKNIPKYRKANKEDSLMAMEYLIKTAQKLKLGDIDKGKVIKSINRVLRITKDCYFIDADINLNMYCYKEKVPFNTDSSYFLSSSEKYSISQTKETANSFFLVNKSKISYIDYGLKYLDSGDFDNDGYEEIIFRMDKYNYTGYLMVTNKWDNVVTNYWNYH
ncbi:hypothetical protein [Ferruginibacter profundus]